jgi:hypothetical protein
LNDGIFEGMRYAGLAETPEGNIAQM